MRKGERGVKSFGKAIVFFGYYRIIGRRPVFFRDPAAAGLSENIVYS